MSYKKILANHWIIPKYLESTLVFLNSDCMSQPLKSNAIMAACYRTESSIEVTNSLIDAIDNRIKSIASMDRNSMEFATAIQKFVYLDHETPVPLYFFTALIRDLNLKQIEINNSNLLYINADDNILVRYTYNDDINLDDFIVLPPAEGEKYGKVNMLPLNGIGRVNKTIVEFVNQSTEEKPNQPYSVNTYYKNDTVTTKELYLRTSSLDETSVKIVELIQAYFESTDDEEDKVKELIRINDYLRSIIIARLERSWLVKITLSFVKQVLDKFGKIEFHNDDTIVITNGANEEQTIRLNTYASATLFRTIMLSA